MLKRLSIIVFVIIAGMLFTSSSFLTPPEAYAYNKPWDQGHDSTNPDDPEEDDDECDNPPCNDCNASACPVIFIDGSYHTYFTDIKLQGKPILGLKRYYRSKHNFRTGYFGYGWSFSYEMRLLQTAGENDYYVSILMPNGQTYKFTDNGDGTYQNPPGINMVLTKLPSGQFELEEQNRKQFLFSDEGRLTRVTDNNGNEIDLSYENGCIFKISTSDGRALTFTKGANGKIQSVTDHTGRTMYYLYDEQGNLISFTNISGYTQSYAYQTRHLLRSVTDFLGNIITSINYDSDGKVTSLTEKGLTTTYTYLSGNRIRKTDIDGTWEYIYSDEGQVISIKDPAGNTVFNTFDSNGYLTAKTDARGNTTAYSHDGLGNVLTITDPLGNVVSFTYYDGTHLVDTKTGPDGIITKYEYDANGNVTTVYEALGTADHRMITYTYDANGIPLTITDPNGNVTTYTYDSAGKKVTETRNGLTVTYEYDGHGYLARTTYPWGVTQEITYDSAGRKITEKDPEGNTVSYSYDPNGNVLTETDRRNLTTTYEYDLNGRVTKVTDPAGNSRIFTWDAKGRLTSLTDRNGITQTISHNYQGLPIQITTGTSQQTFAYDANGNQTEYVDADGNKTTNTFEELNRLSKRTSPGGMEAGYQYDTNGKLMSLNFAGPGVDVTRSYDFLGRELSYGDSLGEMRTRTYDANNNILTETDANGNTTTFEYDAFNRLTKRTYSDGTWKAYRYNNKGVVDQITNSNGGVTTFTHDNNGRVVSSTDIRGTYSLTYDGAGNIVTRTDPNGNTTSYEYNELNLVIKETYADGSTVTYTYWPGGQIKSVTDRNGQTTNFEYNYLGLLTRRDFPGANDDVFTYNGRGQVLTANNFDASITFEYDSEGRLVQETLNGKTTTYAYDLNNKQTQITYPRGRVVTKQFDLRGRLEKTYSGTAGDIAAFMYDLNNRLTQTTYKNGTSIDYTHSNAKLINISNKLGAGADFLGYNLTYDQGKLDKEMRTVDHTLDMAYTYDSVGRLTRVVRGTPQNETDDYTLDGVENWTNWNGEVRSLNNLNQYTSANGVAYEYDSDGNLIEDGNNQYEYDYLNRLINVTKKSDGSVITYEYDAMGRRIARIIGGTTTNYFYDQMGQMIEEQVNGVTTATYVMGNRPNIYTMTRGGDTYYFHQDIRGSVIKITDSTGSVVEAYQYDAYGNTKIYDESGNAMETSAIGNIHGYVGAVLDPDTGLYFMHNRYYSPHLGRFTSVDPTGYTEGGNLYVYALSDPANRVDLLGLSSEKCFKTQDIQWSADTKLLNLLSKIKIAGISISSAGAGVTLSVEACTKECCTQEGQVITSPEYMKASLEADYTASGEAPIPSLGFSAPVLGEVGVFATLNVYIKGSGHYEESVTKYCKIKPGGKACVTLGGSIGLAAKVNIADAAEAALKGSVGPEGQVCYGSQEWEFSICAKAGVVIEVTVEIAWWKYGNTFNLLSGSVCYKKEGFSGSYQYLNFARVWF